MVSSMFRHRKLDKKSVVAKLVQGNELDPRACHSLVAGDSRGNLTSLEAAVFRFLKLKRNSPNQAKAVLRFNLFLLLSSCFFSKIHNLVPVSISPSDALLAVLVIMGTF
jgi:hypothetical protein